MAAIVPDVTIMLEREYRLYFDHWSVYTIELELERVLGKECTFFEALHKIETALATNIVALPMNILSTLVWQACLRDDPTLTLHDVRRQLPNGTHLQAIAPIAQAVLRAWTVSVPEMTAPVVDEEQADASPFASIGELAGPSPVSSSASVLTSSGA